jgi:ketosteroid isomerase-like protein
MPTSHRTELARELYLAFAKGDRDRVDAMLAAEFSFSSPLDVGLNRAGYFERCWPGAGAGQRFEFIRVIEAGDEVIVSYELTSRDGKRGRNTEVLTFDGDAIKSAEVYFGWNL